MTLPEDANAFWLSFNTELGKAKARLESSDLAAVELDALRTRSSELQKYATDSTSILPPYDIRRTQELLESLGKDLREAEVRLKPKKKFTFSSKNKEKAAATKEDAKTAAAAAAAVAASDGPAAIVPATSKDAEGGYTLRDLVSNQVLVLTEKELGVSREDSSVRPPLLITNCNNIVVSARCLLGAARLENCSDCQVFLGPCSTSVYLEGCSRCTVFLASHQLRIHKSAACRLYVRVNSHPIIEDCTDMGFAPYSLAHSEIGRHMLEAGLRDAKCWDNVVDFRWHRTTRSPNWFTLETGDRMSKLPAALVEAGWELTAALAPAPVLAAPEKVPPATVFVAVGASEDDDEL